MATSQPHSIQVDRLSNLPEELLLSVLSLLPTHIAARTAILARRFRHLWEASPSLHLINFKYRCSRHNYMTTMADHALLRRNPSHSLRNMHLDIRLWAYASNNQPMFISYVSSLFSKALSLGLRHLTIDGLNFSCFNATLPIIFSSTTLQSLCLGELPPFPPSYEIPSGITLVALTSLSLKVYHTAHTNLNRLIPELPSLKNLFLEICSIPEITISSNTITKLKLTVDLCCGEINVVTLSIPSLLSLHVEIIAYTYLSYIIPRFQGEIPLLRKAVIKLHNLAAENVNAVAGMLKYISHAEELALHVKEDTDVTWPVPIMFISEKNMLTFFNLKHLDVTACFHKHNLRTIITMLHCSPALESLNIIHETPKFPSRTSGIKRKYWGSKLPRNPDRNYRYACHRNLHLGDNKKELIKSMCKKLSSHMQAHK